MQFDVVKATARLRAMDKFAVDHAGILGDATKLRGTQFEDMYGQGFMRCERMTLM